jgi:hypothetical protein
VTRTVAGVFLLVGLLGSALDGSAQAFPRSGFGLSVGLGGGSTGVTCDQCGPNPGERMTGLSGYLRLGVYAIPHLLIGVEGTGWIRNSEDADRRIAAASLVLVGYPTAASGFFVRGGGGLIRAEIENRSLEVVGDGITWNVGVGYDVGAGGVALTPYVTYLNSRDVTADVDGVANGLDLKPNILQFGLAVTVR